MLVSLLWAMYLWEIPNIRLQEETSSLKERMLQRKAQISVPKTACFCPSRSLLRCRDLPYLLLSEMQIQQKKGGYIKLWDFKKELDKNLKFLDMDPSYAERSLNVGFSGGEKKKAEILQLMMLKPNLAILDETDSGLDVDAVRLVSKGVEEYQKDRDGALLIITHSTRILESLHVDYTHVMVNGHIVATGDGSLVDRINEEGYESFVSEAEEVKEP